MNPLVAALAVVVGYLLGSVSFARLAVRWFAPDEDLADLSVSVAGTGEDAQMGIFGASAASRILGPRAGCLVALSDMLKVALPVLAFRLWHPDQPYFLMTAVAGLIGHNWPAYHNFAGGRGFSVILGSFFVVDWVGAVVTLVAGLLMGTLVFGSTVVADMAWLWLMIPWMWIRHDNPAFLVYAILVNLLFTIAIVPEIKLILRYRREGRLEAYLDGLQGSSPRDRGMRSLVRFGERIRGRLMKAGLVVLVIVSAIVLLGPFLVPVPPLPGTVPPEELADPNSRFIEVNDLEVHYKTSGRGEPAFILLHGFGASVFSWREVMDPLAEIGTVVAFDRPAFGLTERPLSWEEDNNPYTPEAQVALLVGLMDDLGIDEAVLMGNSAGGTVAVNAALTHPDRIAALVLVDAAIYSGGGAPSWIRPLLHTPQMDRIGPLLARQLQARGDAFLEGAWHDPGKITPEVRAGYREPLRAENWDRALWELTKVSRELNLGQELGRLTMPALVISGAEDTVVPVEQSIRLARELPQAELVVIPECGHVPHEECPGPFLDAVRDFLRDLPLQDEAD